MPSNDDVLSALMTHQAEQPNPAQPYLDATKHAASVASQFIPGYGGGLQGAANQEGIQTPDWSKKLGSVLNSPEANAALGTLYLSNPIYSGSTMRHRIFDDNFKDVGHITVKPRDNDLYVHNVEALGPKPENSLGPTEIRSLLKALKDEYPSAETISGLRVSGARTGSADPNAKVRIRPPPPNEIDMSKVKY